jgi:hypothetical protein
MPRLRALSSAVSPGFLFLALVITVLFGVQVSSGAMFGLSNAQTCAVDMERGIAAAERGETEYHGTCTSFVIPPGEAAPEFLEDLDRQLREFRERVDRELETLTGDIWTAAGDRMGGFPLVFFSLLTGAFLSGSTLASGTAAWSLSNGWSRAVWIRSVLGLALVGIVLAYLAFTALFVGAIILQVNGLGLTAGLTSPGLAYLAPLPGLLFYGLVGITAGLLTGKGEIGMMIAFVFAIADFVVAGYLELLPVLPSSFHQASVSSEMARVGREVGALVLAGAAVVLAVALHFYFVGKKDVPDR